MYKIGEFAKMSGMTVKTLRYYDELGLLKPAHVEENSGYRYYTADQLLTIRRIEGFKAYGLTLEMMRPLLTEEVSLTEAESALLKQRHDLETQIQQARRQLAEVNERLAQIARHAAAKDGKISLRSVAPVLVASIRQNISTDQLCLLLDELKRYVRSHGEDSDREITIIWHRKADCDEELSDIEVAIPISKAIPESGSVMIYQLPGVKEAFIYTHRCDPYRNNCPASDVLRARAAGSGYLPNESIPIREVYITADKDIYGRLRIAEMIMPIKRA